jgi:hypothetical protein
MKRKKWTTDEINLIRQLYPDTSTMEIAKKLNRSVTSTYNMAFIIGVKKSTEYMKECLVREAEKLKKLGSQTRFTKGGIPINKGKKMDGTLYEKVKHTFFKTGNEPHNIKYDGYERIDSKDGYIYVRIAKAKFVLKHRKIWENYNGPIPAGHIIIFKDGNKLNCNIENLQMITKRENMTRNSMTNYPPELKKLIKLNNKLKSKLNEK